MFLFLALICFLRCGEDPQLKICTCGKSFVMAVKGLKSIRLVVFLLIMASFAWEITYKLGFLFYLVAFHSWNNRILKKLSIINDVMKNRGSNFILNTEIITHCKYLHR